MTRFRVQPTEIAEWHALVREAQQHSDIHLDEDLESYLVMLLMRFLKAHELASSVLAMEYLAAQHEHLALQKEHLQGVGDKCLLFSGLFPENAEAKRVKLGYFIELGQSAYLQTSELVPEKLRPLFQELCFTFVRMRDVLQAVRELDDSMEPTLSSLAAVELWQDTQSQQALKTLRAYTDSHPVFVTSKESH